MNLHLNWLPKQIVQDAVTTLNFGQKKLQNSGKESNLDNRISVLNRFLSLNIDWGRLNQAKPHRGGGGKKDVRQLNELSRS